MHKILKNDRHFGMKPVFLFLCPESISKVAPAVPDPTMDALWRRICILYIYVLYIYICIQYTYRIIRRLEVLYCIIRS